VIRSHRQTDAQSGFKIGWSHREDFDRSPVTIMQTQREFEGIHISRIDLGARMRPIQQAGFGVNTHLLRFGHYFHANHDARFIHCSSFRRFEAHGSTREGSAAHRQPPRNQRNQISQLRGQR